MGRSRASQKILRELRKTDRVSSARSESKERNRTGNELVHLVGNLDEQIQSHLLTKVVRHEEARHAFEQLALPQILQPRHFHNASHNTAQSIHNDGVRIRVLHQIGKDCVSYS